MPKKYFDVIAKTKRGAFTKFRNVSTVATLVIYLENHDYVFATFYLKRRQGAPEGTNVNAGYWNKQHGLRLTLLLQEPFRDHDQDYRNPRFMYPRRRRK